MGEVLSMRKEQLKKISGSRARGIPNAIIFTFNRTPSDEELHFLDDVMARAALMALTATRSGSATTQKGGRDDV
ncbi:hypothetical protein [Shinella zoogloeoides]